MRQKATLAIAFAVLSVFVTSSLMTAPSFAQTTTTTGSATIKIDSPTADSTVANGVQVVIGGWAIDPAGPNSGVDGVRVYLDGLMDSGGTMIGQATYPKSRPDVGTSFGNAAFANSGFDYLWTPTRLAPGPHRLYVYAHSIQNGWSYQSINVTSPGQGGGPGSAYGNSYGGMMQPYGPQIPPPCVPGGAPPFARPIAPLCPPQVIPAVVFPGPPVFIPRVPPTPVTGPNGPIQIL